MRKKKKLNTSLHEVTIITKEVYHLPKTWDCSTVIDAIYDGTIGSTRKPTAYKGERSILLKGKSYIVPKTEVHEDPEDDDELVEDAD